MASFDLSGKCGVCTGWDQHTGGFGFCPATGAKTTRDHACDAPIPEGLPPMEAYERRRWEANAPIELTVFTRYGR